MRTKNIETNEIRNDATVHRSQFGLPQICLNSPKIVIELDEKSLVGIISLYESYQREQTENLLVEIS